MSNRNYVLWCLSLSLLLILVGVELDKLQEKSFVQSVFRGKWRTQTYYERGDSVTSQERASERAWVSFKKLDASAKAFQIMNKGDFTWSEIGVSRNDAIMQHGRLSARFYYDMLTVFEEGGPVQPWSELQVFPRNIDQVLSTIRNFAMPIFTPHFPKEIPVRAKPAKEVIL